MRPTPFSPPMRFSRSRRATGPRRFPSTATGFPASNSISTGGRHVGRFLGRAGQQEHLLGRLGPRVLEDPALVGDVEEVPVHGVRPGRRRRDRDPVALGVGHEIRPGAEVPVPPGRHDAEVRREGGVGELEAHLVVALAGRPVGDGVRALGAGHRHLPLRDQRPGEGGAEEVAGLVGGVGAQHGEHEVADELLAEIDDVDRARPGPDGLLADGDQLLGLAEVGGVGDDLGAVGLLEPGQDDRGVESAGVCEDDLLRSAHPFIRSSSGELPA